MRIDAVDPDLRDAVRRLPVPNIRSRAMRVLVRWAGRHLLKTPDHAGVRIRDVHDGSARVRLYEPERRSTDAALMWVHGGGFVIGSAKQDDRLCISTAARFGMTVVSAEYRLSPETSFPGPLDDVADVWSWLGSSASALGIDPARIALGGESAGGGLAASLAQRLHDVGSTQPRAQWLFCPMLDDRTASRRELDTVQHWVWDNAANRFGWHSYLGADPGAIDLPQYASAARRLDLTGLPPAWLCVGDIELFHDEVVDYADRLRRAGVTTELEVIAGAPHGFENWAADTPPARALISRAQEWLAEALGLGPNVSAADSSIPDPSPDPPFEGAPS